MHPPLEQPLAHSESKLSQLLRTKPLHVPEVWSLPQEKIPESEAQLAWKVEHAPLGQPEQEQEPVAAGVVVAGAAVVVTTSIVHDCVTPEQPALVQALGHSVANVSHAL